MTAYMNQEKVYPVENFYELSIALAFKNARFLAEAVKRCGSFGITPEKNIYGMKLFYSPLWVGKVSQEELPDKFPETYPIDDIYILIILKGVLLTKKLRLKATYL